MRKKAPEEKKIKTYKRRTWVTWEGEKLGEKGVLNILPTD